MADYTVVSGGLKKIEGRVYYALMLIALYIDMGVTGSQLFKPYGFYVLLFGLVLLANVMERLCHNANIRVLLVSGNLTTVKREMAETKEEV